jgi:hypothetical protein
VRSITTEAVHAAASVMTLGLLPSQLDRFKASADVQVLADLLTVLAGVLALRVLRRTTRRQEQRAARLAGTIPRSGADRATPLGAEQESS